MEWSVDASFLKGMLEHTAAALQQTESTHFPLINALRVKTKN